MSYDYTGIRVKKDGSGGITTYPFSGYEIDPNGVTTKYIRIGIENVAAKKSTGDKLFYYNDHLGGVNVITDDFGSRVQLIEYDPWGKVSREEGTSDPTRRFTGHMLDPESGLYYYGGRYYDPELGRFISPDPFVGQPDDPQNLNRYSYVLNNPVNNIDPDGYFHQVKKKKKKGGFFRSFFGFFIGAVVTALTGNPVLGGFVGGAINAGLNGGNPLLGGVIGAVTAGITAGLLDPGGEGGLSPALVASHAGVAASGLSPPAGGFIQLAEASGGPVVSDAFLQFRTSAPGSDEPGLESPLFDPIDLIGLGAGIIHITKGAGKAALRAVLSRTPGNVGKQVLERHHLLPRELAEQFKRAGLDIEQLTVDLSKEAHRLKPGGLHTGPENWNKQWADFFRNVQEPSQQQILDHLDKMMKQFGLK